MKKIVIFSAFLSPFRSGAEACAEEVALRLCDRFDITIITAKLRRDLPRIDHLVPSPSPKPRGSVKILRVGFGIGMDKWLYPFLAPFAARKLKPDVLHAVLETFAGVALHMCTLVMPHVKQILTLQTTNRNFLRRHMMRTPTVVTAISTILAEQAATLGRKDVIVIPNGIPYDEIRKACEKTQKVPGRVLFVGRLEKMKGLETLLDAITIFSEDVDWKGEAHIVGDGSLRTSLEFQTFNLGMRQRIRFLGRLSGPDLLREYAEAEVFCGLSRSEAMGNVFLEAQAAGCTVIATNVGGIPEIVKDDETGVIVPPDDCTFAAKAMEEVFADETLRRRLREAAIRHAEKFSWDTIAEQYASLY